MVENNNTPHKPRRLHFFVLAISLPLLIALYLFVLPQYSPILPEKLEMAFVGYSAALLGFFSGIRLGAKLNIEDATGIWLLPFLSGPFFGLIVLILPFSLALALLAVGFGAHGVWDVWRGFKGKIPDSYSAVRHASTWLICILLIMVFVLDGVVKAGI